MGTYITEQCKMKTCLPLHSINKKETNKNRYWLSCSNVIFPTQKLNKVVQLSVPQNKFPIKSYAYSCSFTVMVGSFTDHCCSEVTKHRVVTSSEVLKTSDNKELLNEEFRIQNSNVCSPPNKGVCCVGEGMVHIITHKRYFWLADDRIQDVVNHLTICCTYRHNTGVNSYSLAL